MYLSGCGCLNSEKVTGVLFEFSFISFIFVRNIKQIPYEDCKIDNLQ